MSERSKDIPKLKKLFSSRVPIEEYPIYKLNNGKTANMEMLPDPPINMGLTHIKYDASAEPKFNASLHLDLEDPVEVAHFDKVLTIKYKLIIYNYCLSKLLSNSKSKR